MSGTSINDHAADAFSSMHKVKALVDFFQAQNMGDHGINLDRAIHLEINNFWNVRAALCPSKCRTFCSNLRVRD
jgi:hypothetical protein